jgi:diadenosine tetraphosphate (Ap4A) HIT family hydrolase
MLYILIIFVFLVGIFVGGILFSDSRPRAFLDIQACSNCLDIHEIAGLVASVVVQKVASVIPAIIAETDKTLVFRHPRPEYRIHYIFVPKKDIKNIGELTEEDKPYIADLYATVVAVIRREGITGYRWLTNGPGKQDVTYLHYHLMAD